MHNIGQTKREVVETTVFISTEGEVGEHLKFLYEKIWCEACYDCDNEHTKKFAEKLLPAITKLNKILKFRA